MPINSNTKQNQNFSQEKKARPSTGTTKARPISRTKSAPNSKVK